MNYINFRYQGERDTKKKQNIQEAVEYILDKNYGMTVMHDELSKILGYNIEDEEENKKYKSTMARVKNFLIDYGYILKGISGVGFYILKPTQVSQHCYRNYIKRAGRIYDRSYYILSKTKQTNMDETRKEEIENIMKMNNELINKTWDTIKESAYYSRKDYYDSLEH